MDSGVDSGMDFGIRQIGNPLHFEAIGDFPDRIDVAWLTE